MKKKAYIPPLTQRSEVLMEEPMLATSYEPEGNTVISFGGAGGSVTEQSFDDDVFGVRSFGDGSWNGSVNQ